MNSLISSPSFSPSQLTLTPCAALASLPPLASSYANTTTTNNNPAAWTSLGLSSACFLTPCNLKMKKRKKITAAAAAPKGDGDSAQPYPSLEQLCHTIHLSFLEVCVRNMGRPVGQALHEFVLATTQTVLAGHTRERLSLELAYGSRHSKECDVIGCTLTASEETYRTQWLDTIYITLQELQVGNKDLIDLLSIDAFRLRNIVHRVLEGQRLQEEQALVKFDRGLATKGASGGVAAEKIIIAPQFVPIAQLVLLTMKVVNELK